MGASVPINNYQNYFVGFPQRPTLSEPINWNNDNADIAETPYQRNINNSLGSNLCNTTPFDTVLTNSPKREMFY
ncbi:hypothetical protein H5410_048467 [Solanum commersonii]|uniref:Uncharacterized protein n=1 Tax=Solanum commersonii TaxID=4109 RepID=A0A9J5XI62_SOLCO|nr:hypothetical protein H5410_048467 [Solanum commersonii]